MRNSEFLKCAKEIFPIYEKPMFRFQFIVAEQVIAVRNGSCPVCNAKIEKYNVTDETVYAHCKKCNNLYVI